MLWAIMNRLVLLAHEGSHTESFGCGSYGTAEYEHCATQAQVDPQTTMPLNQNTENPQNKNQAPADTQEILQPTQKSIATQTPAAGPEAWWFVAALAGAILITLGFLLYKKLRRSEEKYK